ncbi:DUF6807 family protein [uncultured Chitinophaga sp.]|uniref:DUF6807 family protein n=1 Tax=uncultured Chitinophaga sp. TaxID=339340 RepID=UPI0026307F49|nr:DUF6807 family protein [uncultured Chitinophaga sp.]
MKAGIGILMITSLFACRPSLSLQRSETGVLISEKGKLVMGYQAAPLQINGAFERAGYVHPLYNLDGVILTEDGPADHPYHRGIYWAWHQVLQGGKSVADGWVSEGISFSPLKMNSGKRRGAAYIDAELRWILTEAANQPEIIREHTAILVHPATAHYRAIDFTIRLVPKMDSVALGGANDEKGYGGFCLRFALPSDISFHSGGHKIAAREKAVEAAAWMDFSGSFETGKKSGLTLLVHPESTGASTSWILREKKSMQNSVFPGRIPRLLPPDGWTLKYRLIVHDGSMSGPQLERLYQTYITVSNH